MRDRNRWIALVVLCTGMLMIVLDMTIVNVALPSIQADLGFSQAGLAWVVNAYLIAFAGLLLLAGRLGDLTGRRNVFLAGLAAFTHRVAAVRAGGEPGDAGRGTIPARDGRRCDLRGNTRHDRDHVSRTQGTGQGDRRVRLRRVRRRGGGPAGGGHPHPGAELALDLLRQPAGRRGHRHRGAAGDRSSPRAR